MKKRHMLFLAMAVCLIFVQTQVVAQGGVSINSAGSAPDNSAMLDVSSNNHGLLIPRVSLTGLTDQTTIASPANYLTIYNTNAAIGNGAGMYYWNGNSWTYMASASNGSGASGQVLTSQGSGHAPQWNPIPPSGGGGSICACFNAYQVFTTSGTFTTSSSTTLIKVQVWGGGGGGSGANGSYQGAGGGGGGYAEGIFTVTPSTNYNVVVGPGGAGGTANGGSGSNGSPSNFDILISAAGGGGAPFNISGVPGQGGYGTGGYFNTTIGSGGNSGYSNSLASQPGANGGGSPGGGVWGGGGGGGPGGGNGGSYNSAGNDAVANSGAGGGGAGTGTAGGGGNGGSGLVIVYY